MHRLVIFTLALSAACATLALAQAPEAPKAPRQAIVLVVGAAGADEYGELFRDWAEHWREAADAAQAELDVIGLTKGDQDDRQQLEDAIGKWRQGDYERLWMVLIGHGTYDDESAKFNLRGKDVTAKELAEWLAPVGSPVVVVNCASSSGPFINALSGKGRVVITATKSGYEMNFARFGGRLAEAINDPTADLDKDDQVSVLEAFLTASRRVDEFYEADARLVSEHALLDDNGDGLGTPASFFSGLRAATKAAGNAGLDGARAHQVHLVASDREAAMPAELRQRRDALELQLEALRQRKSELGEDEYFALLQPLLVKIARIYQASEAPDLSAELSPDGPDAEASSSGPPEAAAPPEEAASGRDDDAGSSADSAADAN